MKNNKFYIATPIYYVNGLPHIGHFYATIIANIIYKYKKISGFKSRFTTGVDENSQKAVLIAQEKNMDIMDYLDDMAAKHKSVWDFFNIEYSDFFRTTEDRHHKVVKEVLKHVYNKGDIYEGIYEGLYCVGCEAFKKEDDLIEKDGKKVCPDHLKTPDKIKEKNYFFKLSKYQTWLEEFFEANTNLVNPDFRYNEVKEFTKRGLEDFSISRETNTFGIKLPFLETQVVYVWFDALLFYYSSCRYSRSGDKNNFNFIDESDFFPPDLHVVGKDIIKFHAIYWPCMLASYFDLGEERNGVLHFKKTDLDKLPKQILTTGYFTIDGQKISKSLGNVIEPVEYSKEYSKELLTLYLLSAFPIGNDGDFNKKDAILTYNAKLANNLGNLLNRVVVLASKLDGSLFGEKDENIKIKDYSRKYRDFMNIYDLKNSLDETFKFLDELNKYVDKTEPWSLIKTDEEKARNVLFNVAEGLRIVALNLYSFFPEKMFDIFTKLGLNNYKVELESGNLEDLINKKEIFKINNDGKILFNRSDI